MSALGPSPPRTGIRTSLDGSPTLPPFPPTTDRSPSCFSLPSPAQSSAPPAPEPAQTRPNPPGPSTESISAGPHSKRRRAKRSEEERIQYLRSDPYVAQFEPYRVRCASCDKWIRLRPNSTYCSIPWDAHRKSCLAKKMYVPHAPSCLYPNFHSIRNNKNVYALEERNNLFSKDPNVRKFDPERLLCNM